MWQKGADYVFVSSSLLTRGFDKSIQMTCENVALDLKKKQTLYH